MDKSITTVMLIVISMVMATLLFNAAFPAIVQGGEAIVSMTNRSSQRMRSQIAIIHVAGYMDVSSPGEAYIWVKNIGATTINGIDSLDVFFGKEGNFMRVPYHADSSQGYPYWTWQIENGTDWQPTSTLKITVHYAVGTGSGRYFAQVVTPTGVSDQLYVGM